MPRLFYAVDLPSPLRAAVAALAGALPPGRARGVPAGQVHLTVRFVGDAARAPCLLAGAAAAGRVDRFRLELGGVGVFPHRGAPRVAWVGVRGDLDALRRLAAAVDDALAAVGLPRDPRPYRPHVTFARLRPGPPLPPLAWDAPPAFPVTELVLYASEAGPEGVRHERVGGWPLGAG